LKQSRAANRAAESSIYTFRQPCKKNRFARREDLGLTATEFAELRRLDTPQKIQAYLYGLGQNFEVSGETCKTVREVLRTRNAHCIEGAMLAACALWVQGEAGRCSWTCARCATTTMWSPLFRRHGRWGALSKTNGIGLRSRDPVYRTLRELAISYFHEYCNGRQPQDAAGILPSLRPAARRRVGLGERR